MPLILAVRRLWQESKLKASLSYMVTFKLTWATRDLLKGKKGSKNQPIVPSSDSSKRVMPWEEFLVYLKWRFVNTGSLLQTHVGLSQHP